MAALLRKSLYLSLHASRKLQANAGVAFAVVASDKLGLKLPRGTESDSGWNFAGLLGSIFGFGLVGTLASSQQTCAELKREEESVGSLREKWTEFRDWLSEAGADLEAVELYESETGGLGLWIIDDWKRNSSWGVLYGLRRFLWRSSHRVASFPMVHALTPEVARNDPLLGEHIESFWAGSQDADEAMSIVVFLMFQKLLGDKSPWNPWLKLLPEQFHIPWQYSDDELNELKGTPLYSAVAVQKKALSHQWEVLEASCHELCEKLDISKIPRFEDFIWAYSVYSTRVMAVPTQAGVAKCIIPGLDFCNHSQYPNARWEHPRTCTKSETGRPGSLCVGQDHSLTDMMVDLVIDGKPSESEELFINYGDKSNEELLFSYGFIINSNLTEKIMINCTLAPAPPSQDLLGKRLELLAMKGLTPRFFLPGGENLNKAKWAAIACKEKLSEGHFEKEELRQFFPSEVWEILQPFVLEPEELQGILRNEQDGGKVTIDGMHTQQSAGLHLAKVTTLVSLLEHRLTELEGSMGTGSLESDIQIMEDIHNGIPRNYQWSNLVYRAEQKQITRDWLYISKVHMQEIAAMLQAYKS